MEQQQQQHYSATFLPEVAKEQSWTTKETVVALIRKAGDRGTVTNDLLSHNFSVRDIKVPSVVFRIVSMLMYVMMGNTITPA